MSKVFPCRKLSTTHCSIITLPLPSTLLLLTALTLVPLLECHESFEQMLCATSLVTEVGREGHSKAMWTTETVPLCNCNILLVIKLQLAWRILPHKALLLGSMSFAMSSSQRAKWRLAGTDKHRARVVLAEQRGEELIPTESPSQCEF